MIESTRQGSRNNDDAADDGDGNSNLDNDENLEEQLCHEVGVGGSRPLAASHNQPDATLHIDTHLKDATLHIATHLTDATLHIAAHLTDATLHTLTCPHYTSTMVKFSFSC